MSRTITLELSDADFDRLSRWTARTGSAPDDGFRTWLRTVDAAPEMSPSTPVRSPGALNKLLGCVSVDDPRGDDNRLIDEDLAREAGRGLPGDG